MLAQTTKTMTKYLECEKDKITLTNIRKNTPKKTYQMKIIINQPRD